LAREIQHVLGWGMNVGKKKNAPTAIRMINTVVTDKNACKKIMEVYKERFKNRESGFSTMTPAGYRKGDCAQMVDLEMIDGDLATKQSSSDKKS
jgi:ribosomal protein L17